MVNISVGVDPKSKVFHVHKALLTAASLYLAAAFDGHFKESNTGVLVLLKEDPDILLIVLKSLYQNELPIKDCEALSQRERPILHSTIREAVHISGQVSAVSAEERAVGGDAHQGLWSTSSYPLPLHIHRPWGRLMHLPKHYSTFSSATIRHSKDYG